MGDSSPNRQLFVLRHAERMDFTFGHWIPVCFDKDGKYLKKNLNMPDSVPMRKGGPWDFFKDCPLTRIGLYQATLAGEAMKSSGVVFNHVFCSASLRCVETCTNVLKASGQDHLKINVEPALFEWLSWYRDGLPKWMDADELLAAGFNINPSYVPLVKTTDLTNTKETIEEYFLRNHSVTKRAIENYAGNILLVAHASSLDTCTRLLIGKKIRNEKDFTNMVAKFTYTALATVEETSAGKWQLVEPPIPPLAHSQNASFDWKCLTVDSC